MAASYSLSTNLVSRLDLIRSLMHVANMQLYLYRSYQIQLPSLRCHTCPKTVASVAAHLNEAFQKYAGKRSRPNNLPLSSIVFKKCACLVKLD